VTAPTAELQDAAARQRIRDDTASTLFVEAAAGSGKTTGLVSRILTLVLQDRVPIEHIAAVTFTERAAAELRDQLRVAFEGSVSVAEAGEQDAALAALDGLDLAAIGTLHAFARRILGEHPIEAGIPPLLEVLDEVGSSVATEERWVRLRTELLDDADMTDTLELALSVGVTLEHVRSLVARLNSDWDLVESHVVGAGQPAPPTIPDTSIILAEARRLADLASICTDPDDEFLPALLKLETWANNHESNTSDVDSQLASLQAAGDLKWSFGRAASWAGRKDEIKDSCKEWQVEVADLVAAVRDTCLRCLVHWCGIRVLQIAAERRADGRLEFHDLLVLARNVLREVPEVRGSLQQRYQRLLLDEFQDTDPIQIEIAVRIAGGEQADQTRWEDVVVPPGSLFVVGDPKQSIYRFRRADIGTYLRAQHVIGGEVSLSSNFRTGTPIIDWVNEVFGELITEHHEQQPAYVPFAPVRVAATAGPPVTVVGTQPHEGTVRAGEVRREEARDVASIIRRALEDGWTTQAPTGEVDENSAPVTTWRPLGPDDITILMPARTSLPYLEEALDDAAIEYRTESTSLVYHATEVRDLFAALRAIADPSDAFALVTALRSPLFGCGDDDLWTWKRDGGRFTLFAEPPEGLDEHPVAGATAYLRGLHHDSRRLSPSEVLTRLAADRRMFETAAIGPRARDSWRRLRFVIDQARAWSEAEHGGLRAYVAWAAAQSADGSRVAESVLPESDMDSVRIMTVHAAKGLEFPMVVLSGMSSRPPGRTGVQLLWSDTGYAVRLSKDLQTNDFAERVPIDEQMSEYERMRLMYVATTRARDHLVVSLHRDTTGYPSNAKMLAKVGAHEVEGVHQHAAEEVEAGVEVRRAQSVSPPPEYAAWLADLQRSRESSQRRSAQSASGLEGTDPEAHEADAVLPPEELTRAEGLAKGARDLEQPAWAKGRYGSAVGRAVHGVMQTVSLDGADGLEASVAAQCLAEDVSQFTDLVRALCEGLLSSDVVRRAATREHWRESYVATVEEGGTVLEGFVDLIYREDGGSLVVVDYKTDDVPDAALAARTAFYAPQLRSYSTVLARTGARVADPILLFARPIGVFQVSLSQ